MEIVLLEDVKALGKKGQIVKVNDGYARNFILPKKLGVEATSKNLNDLKLQKANAAKVAAEQLAAAKELAEKIEKLTVTLKMKAGEGGKAFGSVSSKEIAAAAADQLKLDIDKKKLVLPETIFNAILQFMDNIVEEYVFKAEYPAFTEEEAEYENGVMNIKTDAAFNKLMSHFLERLQELDEKIDQFAEQELRAYLLG